MISLLVSKGGGATYPVRPGKELLPRSFAFIAFDVAQEADFFVNDGIRDVLLT